MNKLTISGYIGQEPEMRYLPNGDAVLDFSVGVKQFKKDAATMWVKCSMFGDRAAKVAEFVHKGTFVIVDGSLKADEVTGKNPTYTDKQTKEVKVGSFEMRVQDLELGPKTVVAGE